MAMPVAMALIGVAVLFAAALLAIVLQALRGSGHFVYAICFMACAVLLGIACAQLLAAANLSPTATPAPAPSLVLPMGLPWIGAHFRIDPLSAFFLLVTNLGGAGASLFAIGYGRHETAPGRVLPFYPAFLAGMNLVVLADDAFAFLIAWELMSLAS